MSRDHLIHYLHAQGYDRDGIARVLAQQYPGVKQSYLRAIVTRTIEPHPQRRGPRVAPPEPATTG